MFSLGYLIDSQICVIILYLLYYTLLDGRITHRSARAYLLTFVPLGLTIPLIKLPLLPAIQVSGSVVPLSYDYVPTESAVMAPMSSTEHISLVLLIYLTVVLIMVLGLVVGAVKITLLMCKSPMERVEGLRVIFTPQKITAYSIFNYIFVNKALRGNSLLHEILAHEECHIRLRHTIDLLFMSTLRALFWFNPAVWHTSSLLRQVHEYQVDEKVMDRGLSKKHYVELLILSEVGISPEFGSPFSYALTKKRLSMLSGQRIVNSRKRLLWSIPVVMLLLTSFSLTSRAQQQSNDTQSELLSLTRTIEQQPVNKYAVADTIIRERNSSESTTDCYVLYKNSRMMERFASLKQAQDYLRRSGIRKVLYKNNILMVDQGQPYDVNNICGDMVIHNESSNRDISKAVTVITRYSRNGERASMESFYGLDSWHITTDAIKSIRIFKGDRLDGEKAPADFRRRGALIIEIKEDAEPNRELKSISLRAKHNDERNQESMSTTDSKVPIQVSGLFKIERDAEQTENQSVHRSSESEGHDYIQPTEIAKSYAESPTTEIKDISELSKWMQHKVVYPIESQEMGSSGSVSASFLVNRDGVIKEISIDKGVDQYIDRQVVETLKAAPRINPIKNEKGEIVSVRSTIVIYFKSH